MAVRRQSGRERLLRHVRHPLQGLRGPLEYAIESLNCCMTDLRTVLLLRSARPRCRDFASVHPSSRVVQRCSPRLFSQGPRNSRRNRSKTHPQDYKTKLNSCTTPTVITIPRINIVFLFLPLLVTVWTYSRTRIPRSHRKQNW